MPSQTTRPALTATVLAVLWVTSGRCDVSESRRPGCDNGKLHLDRDLSDDVHCNYSVTTWPKSTQRLPGIDTVYDPEPPSEICMNKSISYNQIIPNSGAYRPVRAESGEYLYCPPQRWLNNLHHAATVLLYHPCAPVHEHLLLSVLARSCLPYYIITPYPQLNTHMPIALVSWGRTLELSTAASSGVCDWLETTISTTNKSGGVSDSRKYNLLLTRSAEQPQQQHVYSEEQSAKMKESVRRCCEQIMSREWIKRLQQNDTLGKSRQRRAVVRKEKKSKNTTPHVSAEDTQSYNRTLSSTSAVAIPRTGTLSDSTQSKAQNTNQSLSPQVSTPTAAQQPSPRHTALSKTKLSPRLQGQDDGVSSEHNHTVRPRALTLKSKDEGSVNDVQEKHSDKDSTADSTMKDNETVDVKERELEPNDPHIDTDAPQIATQPPSSRNCDSCKKGEPCDCNKGPETRSSVVNKGMSRTPRTDEAVWAAAALGFLLILLTLSVLHTRLYRHWRTMPSLYWHDPQLDYDSVADVIRRRLHIAKRRRKRSRSRRQECVLLPSSSSSDELP